MAADVRSLDGVLLEGSARRYPPGAVLRLTRRAVLAGGLAACGVAQIDSLPAWRRAGERSWLKLNDLDRLKSFIAIGGQSNARGRAPAITTEQPFWNQRVTDDGLVPLVEAERETIASAATNMLTHLCGGPRGFRGVVAEAAVGGAAYAQLKKGTSPYRTLLRRLDVARADAAGEALGLRAIAFLVIHGETDNREGRAAEYAAFLAEWQRDFEADAAAETAQWEPVPLITDQMSSWTHFSGGPGVALAQLAASEQYPNQILCVGPKYPYDYEDGLHLLSAHQPWLGEQYGKVMGRVFVDGETWRPLSPRDVWREGDRALGVSFWVPAPPLVFDTERVAPREAFGFELGHPDPLIAPPPIDAVVLAGDRAVRIECAAPVPAGTRIRYALSGAPLALAGPGFRDPRSPRGNLRDSDQTPSFRGGFRLFNWCCHFEREIPG